MKIVKGLCHQAVDLITAALGYVELNQPDKATKHMKEAVGVMMEACQRAEQLMHDLEGITDQKLPDEKEPDPPEVRPTESPPAEGTSNRPLCHFGKMFLTRGVYYSWRVIR